MKRLTFIFLTITLTTTVCGQRYLCADIQAKADSILRNYISDSVFYNNCLFDIHSYYEYKNIFGKSRWETLNKFKRTKGQFVKVEMRWNLTIPYPICPAFDTIKGQTSFMLDYLLRPTQKPYLAFIPDFYWNKDNCYLITGEQALTIAKQQNLKTGIDKLHAVIIYESKEKTFTWQVSHTLCRKKDGFNNDVHEGEFIYIDALTGMVKLHEIIVFFPIY
jgi:hypothetical protein